MQIRNRLVAILVSSVQLAFWHSSRKMTTLYCIHHPLKQGWLLLCVWHMLCAVLQAERLEELQERLSVPYDSDNRQHQQQLQELWALAFPELPFSTLKSNQWKEMGWQVGEVGQGLVQLDIVVTTFFGHVCSRLKQ
jgi:hypothetical protein